MFRSFFIEAICGDQRQGPRQTPAIGARFQPDDQRGREKNRSGGYRLERVNDIDLDGNASEILDRAYRLGIVQLHLGGRPISERELNAISITGG